MYYLQIIHYFYLYGVFANATVCKCDSIKYFYQHTQSHTIPHNPTQSHTIHNKIEKYFNN